MFGISISIHNCKTASDYANISDETNSLEKTNISITIAIVMTLITNCLQLSKFAA